MNLYKKLYYCLLTYIDYIISLIVIRNYWFDDLSLIPFDTLDMLFYTTNGEKRVTNFPISPQMHDNTEGVCAFEDILIWPYACSLLDIGCGNIINSKKISEYLEKRYPNINYFGVDPYERSKEHNIDTQRIIEKIGGVDIVTSMSVLNTIRYSRHRLRHIRLVHDVLFYGGFAYFKIWAGDYPMRGRGKQNGRQNNKWAYEYVDEIEYIFGKRNVYLDCEKNLIIAYK